MSRNLQSRIENLEVLAGTGRVPNGGLVIVLVGDDETREQAIARTMEAPWVKSLSKRDRRRLTPIAVGPEDVGTL